MNGRFDYVKYDKEAIELQNSAKIMCCELEEFINELSQTRPKSLALAKLEEVYMWIGKAIRDEQVAGRGAELQEERNDE